MPPPERKIVPGDSVATRLAGEGKRAGETIRIYECYVAGSNHNTNYVRKILWATDSDPGKENTPMFAMTDIISVCGVIYDNRRGPEWPYPASVKDLGMAHLHFEDTEAPNAGYYFILFFQPPEIQEIIRRRGPHRNNLVDRLGGVEIWGSIFPARCVFGPPLESGAPDFIWLDMPEIEDECPEYVEAFLNRTAGTINIPDAM